MFAEMQSLQAGGPKRRRLDFTHLKDNPAEGLGDDGPGGSGTGGLKACYLYNQISRFSPIHIQRHFRRRRREIYGEDQMR